MTFKGFEGKGEGPGRRWPFYFLRRQSDVKWPIGNNSRMYMNSIAQKLFAKRIGGQNFGKVAQTFKFTLIDNAKRAFKEAHPEVKVIDMGVGEPEELPADFIIEDLFKEAKEKANRIYPCNGILPFQQAAARYLKRIIGEDFDPATEIMHCVGTKTGLAQIPLAFVDPGDAVITTTPGYPVLPRVAEWLGAGVVPLKLEKKNNYLPSLTELELLVREQKPKLLLLNYPNNPTGAVAPRAFYENVVGLAREYGFLIVQDAAYADFVFEGDYVSPLQVPGGKDVTLELYSLSKSYNMQGYRIGFVVGGAPLIKAFALVKDNTDNGQFIAIQKAGISALDEGAEFLAANRAKYGRRLKEVSSILNAAGIPCQPSPGTFYLYIPVPDQFKGHKFKDAQAFTDFLITNFGMISVPWDEAGPHVRLSMTFEVGNGDFADEQAVFSALRERLVG